jgi:hypothetical protein
MGLDTVRGYFAQPAGTVLNLELRNKAGETRSITLTLRDYV